MDDKYGLKELQGSLLAMLIDIDRVCRENNINYSLYGGTLLGAIRHKGFIPWDDDVDILFERNEYEKFIKIYQKYGDKKYYVGTVFFKCLPAIIYPDKSKIKNSDFNIPGPWVSLFIFDKCPDNNLLAKIKVFLSKTLIGMMGKPIHYSHFGIKTKIVFSLTSILGKLFTERWIKNKHTELSMLGGKCSNSFYSTYNNAAKEINNKYPKEIISKYIDVPFEGYKFKAMSGYHDYLKKVYGDYMTPPPVEQRIPKHH